MKYIVQSFPSTVNVELSVATSNVNASFEWYAFNEGPFPGVETTNGSIKTSKFTKSYNIDKETKGEGYCKIILPSKAFINSTKIPLEIGLPAPNVTIASTITADSSGIIDISVPYPTVGGPFYGDWQYSFQQTPTSWLSIPNQEKYTPGEPFRLNKLFSELTSPWGRYKHIRFVMSTIADSKESNSCAVYDSGAVRPTVQIIYPSPNVYFRTNESSSVTLTLSASDESNLVWYSGKKSEPISQFAQIGTGKTLILDAINYSDLYEKTIIGKASNLQGSSFSNKINVLYDNPPIINAVDPSYDINVTLESDFQITTTFENAEEISLESYSPLQSKWLPSDNITDVVGLTSYVFQNNVSNFEVPYTSLRVKATNDYGSVYSRELVLRPKTDTAPVFTVHPTDYSYVTEDIQPNYTFTAAATKAFRIDWESSYNSNQGPWFPISSGTSSITIPISTLKGEGLRWFRAKAFNITNDGNVNWVVSNPASLGIQAAPVMWNFIDPIPDPISFDFTLSLNQLRGKTITWQTKLPSDTNWTTLDSYNIQQIYAPAFTRNAIDFEPTNSFRCIISNDYGSLTSEEVQLDLNFANDAPTFNTQPTLPSITPIYQDGNTPLSLAVDVDYAKSLTWQFQYKYPWQQQPSGWSTIGYTPSLNLSPSFLTNYGFLNDTILYFRCIAGNQYGTTVTDTLTTKIVSMDVSMDLALENNPGFVSSNFYYKSNFDFPIPYYNNQIVLWAKNVASVGSNIMPTEITWQVSNDGLQWSAFAACSSYTGDNNGPTNYNLIPTTEFQNLSVLQLAQEVTTPGYKATPVYDPIAWPLSLLSTHYQGSNSFMYITNLSALSSYTYLRCSFEIEGIQKSSKPITIVKDNNTRLPKFSWQPPKNLGTIKGTCNLSYYPPDGQLYTYNIITTKAKTFPPTFKIPSTGDPATTSFVWQFSSANTNDFNIYTFLGDQGNQANISYTPPLLQTDTTTLSVDLSNSEHRSIIPPSRYVKVRPIAINIFGYKFGNWSDLLVYNEPFILSQESSPNKYITSMNQMFVASYEYIQPTLFLDQDSKQNYQIPLSCQWQYNLNPNDSSNNWINIGPTLETRYTSTDGLSISSIWLTENQGIGEVQINYSSTAPRLDFKESYFPADPNKTLTFRIEYKDRLSGTKYTTPVGYAPQN